MWSRGEYCWVPRKKWPLSQQPYFLISYQQWCLSLLEDIIFVWIGPRYPVQHMRCKRSTKIGDNYIFRRGDRKFCLFCPSKRITVDEMTFTATAAKPVKVAAWIIIIIRKDNKTSWAVAVAVWGCRMRSQSCWPPQNTITAFLPFLFSFHGQDHQ